MSANAPGRRYQLKVLTERYLLVQLGDLGTLALLVGQAPLIGWLCTLVWGSIGEPTRSLYFVLCLASVWFGCINACREIVKERNVLERERFFGLSMAAYVGSKLAVLAVLGLLQVLLLQIAVEWKIALEGPFLLHTFALWGACVCGAALGLLVSALAKTQERAVGAIPLLLMPQILFSEMAIPEDMFSDVVAFIEKFMPVRWAWRVFEEGAANDPAWGAAILAVAVLAVYAAVLSVGVIAVLLRRKEV